MSKPRAPWLALAAIAAPLPSRTILGEAGPYLTRYLLRDLADGGHVFLHFFHRSDADGDLHNHPWSGTSVILAGGYREERLDAAGTIALRTYLPGDANTLAPDTFHRVDLLDPQGCWTLFSTSARVQSWGFRNRVTGAFTPWRVALAARGLEAGEPVYVARGAEAAVRVAAPSAEPAEPEDEETTS